MNLNVFYVWIPSNIAKYAKMEQHVHNVLIILFEMQQIKNVNVLKVLNILLLM